MDMYNEEKVAPKIVPKNEIAATLEYVWKEVECIWIEFDNHRLVRLEADQIFWNPDGDIAYTDGLLMVRYAYGRTWRIWVGGRPSEAQREEVKWEYITAYEASSLYRYENDEAAVLSIEGIHNLMLDAAKYNREDACVWFDEDGGNLYKIPLSDIYERPDGELMFLVDGHPLNSPTDLYDVTWRVWYGLKPSEEKRREYRIGE